MSLAVKAGVRPRLLVIAAALANVAERDDLHLVITSGTDGTHMAGSKHYTGEALDVRTSNLTPELVKLVVSGLRDRLGTSYDIVVEADHIHCEYDPEVKA